MKVVVASDKFKGTFSSEEVGRALAEGIRAAGGTPTVLAVADGGDGTAAALGGERRSAEARDALGRWIEASFTLLEDGTAVVEAAEAVGLWRLSQTELDPAGASSAGVGDLVVAAVEAGAERILVAAGGTATLDGGIGAVEVIGDLDEPPELVVICDVATVWEDAIRVFGPQKGADPAMVELLSDRLDALAAQLPRDPRGVAWSGCGGGLSGALWASFGARLEPGADFVLDLVGLDEALVGADLIVTGEGRLDEQTATGKLVARVAARAQAARVRCVAVVGRDDLGDDAGEIGLDEVLVAGSVAELMRAGRALVTG